MSRRIGLGLALPGVALFLLSGCSTVVQHTTTAMQVTGLITSEQKERYDRRAVQTEKAARPMSSREEHYVGRAVAATILGQYSLYRDERLTAYLNRMGQALALASDRPFTHGGYHFAILDTDEVNALACPGGFIFITRGMLEQAENEEELAAILAHEVAHVNHKDGLAAIQKARWVQVATSLGADAVRDAGGGQLGQLATLFEGSVNDVVETLVVNGYGRQQELAADIDAMTFMHRLGYDPHGLTDYVAKLAREQDQGANEGFFATHPGLAERLDKARAFIAEHQWRRLDHEARNQRFAAIIEAP